MPTDEQLIKEIKAGSQAAMELLVKRHYQSIFAYMYRRTSDYHLAYDLTQEVFIKMMQSMPRYKKKGKFSNWLFTIAVNHSRDFYRSKRYRDQKDEQKLPDTVEQEGNQVWDFLHKKIERVQMKKAIDQLPSAQKEAVLLRFYHDLKIREIAEVTRSNESTVKSRLRQAIQKLNETITDERAGEMSERKSE